MCAVHLLPEIDELRVAEKLFRCGECGRIVQRKTSYRHIEGVLDDDSNRRYLYKAHECCYTLAVFNVSDDGCFQYAGAVLQKTATGDDQFRS